MVGTSIGALNGAFICQNEYELLKNLWLSMKFSSCFTFNRDINLVPLISVSNAIEFTKELILYGGLNPDPLRKMLRNHLSEKKIRNSNINFGLVTICLSNLKAIKIYKNEIPNSRLIEYLMASCSLPGIRHEHICGKTFLDGGLYDNLPIDMLCCEKDISEIIVIDIKGPGIKRNYNNKFNIPIRIIEPSINLGGILEFSRYNISNNMLHGYYDTLNALK